MVRYVVLEHRRDGVHWDFMLEVEPGGALRTWAVDAPPAPGLTLPARALADHRAAYLDYEGEVSGGRGRVRRVDRGAYEPVDWGPDLVRVRLSGGQLVGLVELRPAAAGDGSASAGESGESGPSRGSWTFRLGNLD